MIRVHLADRGTATFVGSFPDAYRAAQAYIRDHASLSPEKADDDRPEGVSEKDWRFYCTPGKARIVNVIQAAERPLITQEVCDAARVCRTSACRILSIMAKLGEVRNVGAKSKSIWVKV